MKNCTAIATEKVLAKDWDTEEEKEAWKNLRSPEKLI